MLRNMRIFSALPAASLETLAREARYVTVHAGHRDHQRGRGGGRLLRDHARVGPCHQRRARDQAARQRRRLRGDRAASSRQAHCHRHRDERDDPPEHRPRGVPNGDARAPCHVCGRREDSQGPARGGGVSRRACSWAMRAPVYLCASLVLGPSRRSRVSQAPASRSIKARGENTGISPSRVRRCLSPDTRAARCADARTIR